LDQHLDEVTVRWRKLHNKEIRDLFSPSIIRMIKSRMMSWARYVAQTGEKRNTHKLSVGKMEVDSPLGRLRCRSVDNIKMGIGNTEWGGMV
jgi:hypothetical protein